MKKTYMKPQNDVVKARIRASILAGSNVAGQENETISTTPSTPPSVTNKGGYTGILID